MAELSYEGFDELEKLGYISDYGRIKNGVCTPILSVEDAKANWAQQGEVVQYNGFHGYPYQKLNVESNGINIGDKLTVTKCNIGDSSSSYSFREIKGSHNSVMFDRISTGE